MCGRFTLTSGPDFLINYFQLEFFPEDYSPSYNIAPSQSVLSVVWSNHGRRAGYIEWGLIPHWVKDPKKWKPLINARLETLEEKASFKHLLNRRRCILLADSFYEWKKVGDQKIPYRILKKDENPFAFAALWDRNSIGEKERITCTIITTEANAIVQEVHNRMPVILDEDEMIEAWLNVKDVPYTEVRDRLMPYPADKQKLYPVATIVNSPKNNSPDCILPVSL